MRRLLFLALLCTGVPTAATAQLRECSLVTPSDFTRTETPQGTYVQFTQPVRFLCTGNVIVQADRAVQIEWTRELQLMQNALYEDAERRITADYLNYIGSQNRLTGSGNVVVTDKKSGSVLRGESLVHEFAAAGVEARTDVQGGRPHATVRSATASPDDPPLDVDADQFRIVGNRVFSGIGNVAFTRGDLRGTARQAEFEQAGGRVLLMGGAQLRNERFELVGDTIDARTRDEQLTQVFARLGARVIARDVTVSGAELRIFFEEGRVHRLVSLADRSGMRDAERAQARAERFSLAGDSIDVLAPGEALERVLAVGGAYAERTVPADSLPEGLPEIARRDWLRGDTITGFFTADTSAAARAAADTATAPARVLERLLAVSESGAQALHRLEGSEAAAGGINYLVARRIAVVLEGGEVRAVDAEGDVRGVHLQTATGATPPVRE